MVSPHLKLLYAEERVGECMDEILQIFKPGCRITVAVRTPNFPSRDFLMTSEENTQDVIDMLIRCKNRP